MKYAKVTDISQIAKGDTVIIVCEEDNVALATSSTTIGRQATNIDVNNGVAYGNDYVLEASLVQTKDGKWGLKIGSNASYLGLSNTGFGITSTASRAMCNIRIENGNAIIAYTGTTTENNTIGYTTDNSIFSCYANNPYSVQLYRKGGVSTGINDINANDNSGMKAIFNLNGQRVSEQQMGKGLYIINGKKVIR